MSCYQDVLALPARLLQEEKPRLLRFIKNRVPSNQEPEDIFQEAVARALGRFKEGHSTSDPVGYTYRVVMNIINDFYRNQEEVQSLQELPENTVASEAPQPERVIAAKQRLEMFMTCVASLPEETRNLIVLRKVHGLTNGQIAARLGLSGKVIEKRINRAMKSIEGRMEQNIEYRPSSIRNKVK
ncbi:MULTISPECIES: RNA polymerase sigma factor [unclassified Oceanobacter]|uniref:RNA polymerase sigma factor n=1 Tax=unclassified Oceanobacter TaxID=2620260 RepID=UPI0027341762|nr:MULTISPECIES: sigma-70 family RNA polymerase sigma factor [unclassified Oceanobacter]MDP2548719.1 sigma-70 family RNA polymerase sigma factor [Oceanobacter sp. 4_MG-2023]MDP2609330.1 sigma-70 family RNA polymerase sigma factor [Oceanobacter sp. 1_MG-2023]MDP2612573.1 sigma-70 family RNA polymerase sigma factor [Oceanobacter sp. 2_MG-2023]